MPRRRTIRYTLASPPPPRPWFGIERVAELLEMPVARVTKLLATGRFPQPFQRGTRTFWTLEALRQYVSDEMDRKGVPRPSPRALVV